MTNHRIVNRRPPEKSMIPILSKMSGPSLYSDWCKALSKKMSQNKSQRIEPQTNGVGATKAARRFRECHKIVQEGV
jgi:hypothetical protein